MCSDDDAAVAAREPGLDGVGAAAHPVSFPRAGTDLARAVYMPYCANRIDERADGDRAARLGAWDVARACERRERQGAGCGHDHGPGAHHAAQAELPERRLPGGDGEADVRRRLLPPGVHRSRVGLPAKRPGVGSLGPGYLVVYTVPGPNGNSFLRQRLYPFTSAGAVTFMAKDQRYWGTRHTRGGWSRGSMALRDSLVQAGLPEPH